MKVVSLEEHRNKISSKTLDTIVEELEKIKAAAEEGKLHQFILQYDVDIGEEDVREESGTTVVFWNKSENMDEMLGFCGRLVFRMNLIAESMEEE